EFGVDQLQRRFRMGRHVRESREEVLGVTSFTAAQPSLQLGTGLAQRTFRRVRGVAVREHGPISWEWAVLRAKFWRAHKAGLGAFMVAQASSFQTRTIGLYHTRRRRRRPSFTFGLRWGGREVA